MKNNDTTKVLLGIVIGGIIGGGLYCVYHAVKEHKMPMLNKLGQALGDLGEILEESQVNERKEAVEEIEKTLPKGDNLLNNALTWVATGINLWKKIKKG